MMELTARQEKILNVLTQEYINTAEPISSKLLKKKCALDICEATIRNELQELTENDFILQPHVSAGRVPTNKAYRYFVDKLFSVHDKLFSERFFKEFDEIFKQTEDRFKTMENLTKSVAQSSSNLTFVYLPEKDFLWKEGWQEVLKNPEFKETSFLYDFIETVDDFEKNIKDFVNDMDDYGKVKVYIGKEESSLKSKDLSLITLKTKLPAENGFLAILGPKRMDYNRNISLISSLVQELEMF